MRILLLSIGLLSVLSTLNLRAQERAPRNVDKDNIPVSPSASDARRDWSDPYRLESGRVYLQRRAQEQTAAREARIEGMRWLGYSPLRPTASGTPFMSHAPTWGPYASTGGYFNTYPYWNLHTYYGGPSVP